VTPAPDMLTAALAWVTAGCSVVRVRTDGTKRPDGEWKTYQHTPATRDQVTAWFGGGHPGLGLVCGAVSGNLELLEIEGRAVADGTAHRYLCALDDHGLGDLRTRLLTGYIGKSPSGGMHLLYRVDGEVGGNTKLASRPATDRPGMDVLIETRGEGGFVVAAPSHGGVHPTGRPYELVGDSVPGRVVTISADDRDALHAVASLLDETPTPPPMPDPILLERRDPDGGTPPGEDFNARGNWCDILEPAGWSPVRQFADRTYWRRPGKTGGISAVTGGTHGDYLYVWSTSTELPAEHAMSKWRAYATLQHGGDFSAAARDLRHKGYGSPLTVPTRVVRPTLPTLAPPASTVARNGAATTHPAPGAPIEYSYERSDDGNALALIDRWGAAIRYCPERGRWLAWTGTRWQWCPSGGGVVREYVKRCARALPDPDADARRWKQRSLSALGTTATVQQAATDPRIVAPIAELDARAFELNTPAGIVDLTTGRLRPNDPTALHTRITTVGPDPDADPARWSAFLAETFAGLDGLTGYVQRLVGYSVAGVVREHILPFAFGSGANGKGVLLETLRAVLGDYATTAPNGFLMAKAFPSHETEIARLKGARMVICSEVNEGDRFDEARVKQLTGGDSLTARFMRADHFTFAPSHTLWLMGNHQPHATAGGHSFWRRLRIVPFANTVPDDRQVPDLQGILAAEHGPAVLSWVIAGAADYFRAGLGEPESVRAATADYERGQDSVGQFVAEECRLGGGDHVVLQTTVLRRAYERWCQTEDVPAVSQRALGLALRSRFGVGSSRTMAVRYYTGIALSGDVGVGSWMGQT
jgi:P4 family phage/plasmid primase-like protien